MVFKFFSFLKHFDVCVAVGTRFNIDKNRCFDESSMFKTVDVEFVFKFDVTLTSKEDPDDFLTFEEVCTELLVFDIEKVIASSSGVYPNKSLVFIVDTCEVVELTNTAGTALTSGVDADGFLTFKEVFTELLVLEELVALPSKIDPDKSPTFHDNACDVVDLNNIAGTDLSFKLGPDNLQTFNEDDESDSDLPLSFTPNANEYQAFNFDSVEIFSSLVDSSVTSVFGLFFSQIFCCVFVIGFMSFDSRSISLVLFSSEISDVLADEVLDSEALELDMSIYNILLFEDVSLMSEVVDSLSISNAVCVQLRTVLSC